MGQGYNNNDLLMPAKPADLKQLYDTYADKLLGYILAIVNNRYLAENCTVNVFTAIYSTKKSLQAGAYSNTWSWLMALAQDEIANLSLANDECKSVTDNYTYIEAHKYLNRMNDVQRLVFCGIYYHHKTTAALANELNLTEQALRLRLKEAFMIIRDVKDEN